MSTNVKGRDITGETFGKLTVLRLDDQLTKHKQKKWICRCSCGSVTSILQHSLVTGNTSKCNQHPKNEYKIDGDVVYVDVSTNKFPDTWTKISRCDLDKVLKHKTPKGKMRWMAHNDHNGKWGTYVSGTDRKTRLHRVIANCPSNMYVDHINGDTLDNRQENLRIVTPKENAKNVRKRVTNTSGYTGVVYKDGLWSASIQHDYKKHYLGSYDTKEEANAAYRASAKLLGFSKRHGL